MYEYQALIVCCALFICSGYGAFTKKKVKWKKNREKGKSPEYLCTKQTRPINDDKILFPRRKEKL
jgi:hypothetical protein